MEGLVLTSPLLFGFSRRANVHLVKNESWSAEPSPPGELPLFTRLLAVSSTVSFGRRYQIVPFFVETIGQRPMNPILKQWLDTAHHRTPSPHHIVVSLTKSA